MLPGDVYYYSANSCVLCVKRGQLKKVQKPGTGLNPYADAFFCSKTLTAPVEKGWEPGEEFLTNGNLSIQDEVGGGFSSGDSPVSDSPPAPIIEGTLEAGAPPPEFVPDSLVGTGVAAMPLVMGAEAAEGGSLGGEEMAEGLEQAGDGAPPHVDLVTVTAVTMQNGLGPGQSAQGSVDGGPPVVQVSEASSLNSAPSDLRSQLQTQLEYYFSRDNLVQDHYLQSQMDGDQYVPITTIANFNQVVKLTTNYDFIVEVLKSSKVVQVDETGTKVRPRLNRTVLMLREIPENTPKSEVEALFQDEKCPKLVHCEFAHNGYWYVTFNTDEDAASAYCFLRERNIMFRNKPVLARIKARPLVRPGGGGHYITKSPSQPQQDATVPFMRQQQAQFPIMPSPVPQYVSQQQVPQPVSPFHLYNLQTMMPQWPNTAAPTFLDPGAMLTMNGLQATAVKPSSNHTRNMYHHPVRTNNNRGMGKPHHRPQSISTDKVQESRGGGVMDRSHTNHLSSSRTSPRNNNSHQHSLEPLSSQLPPFARSRSEGSSTGGGSSSHFSSTQPSGLSSAPTPLVPEDSLPLHLPAQTPNTKTDSLSTSAPHNKRGNYRKSRRNEEGANKNSRMNPGHGGKDGKPHEPHFELEATSFPPLPGSSNNSSSGDAPEGSKLSDVVKGTTRPVTTRLEDKVKATPAPASASAAPVPVSASAAVPMPDPVTVTDAAPVTVASSTAAAVTTPPAASPAVGKETEVVANGNHSHHSHSSTSATAVESSAHTSRCSKTSSQPPLSPAAKPSSESSAAPKQATVSTAPVKVTSPAPAGDAAPARLSYAQMVARKQQAENVSKQNSEEGGTPQTAAPATARPAAQTTLREQSQTQASASVSASVPPKSASASASARPPSKDGPRKDFEPKEPRFPGGGRGAKENRNGRQPRYERRRVDRDVKVPTK